MSTLLQKDGIKKRGFRSLASRTFLSLSSRGESYVTLSFKEVGLERDLSRVIQAAADEAEEEIEAFRVVVRILSLRGLQRVVLEGVVRRRYARPKELE
ncbi:hypothetical protein HYALB_00010497 [Hymenoscyphus albidus]|uniref:Uncharacterized protein n=1 Tax=Hymenoscyphus albidus TaxID=595503 RepID=A0A9N9LVM4_9HELO|nr:hypothetical protein HYALB_00010497 [Hymenoscyphus albidus]